MGSAGRLRRQACHQSARRRWVGDEREMDPIDVEEFQRLHCASAARRSGLIPGPPWPKGPPQPGTGGRAAETVLSYLLRRSA
jgi:hypothetical protein